MIIYKITNNVNGKIYIGQTRQSLKKRWLQHQEIRKKSLINSAIKKYGKENFTIEIIDTASNLQELNEKEIHWIKELDSMNRDKGYNLNTGGNSYKLTEEHKLNISKSKKGISTGAKSAQGKKNMSEAAKTRNNSYMTEEWKNKCRERQLKRLQDPNYIKFLKESNTGRIFSEETRKKMSESQKGKCNTRGKTWKIKRKEEG